MPLVVLALSAVVLPVHAQVFTYDGSLRVSRGDYTFDDAITSAFLINELSVEESGWWVELTVPVIYQDSPDVRYAGGMPMPGGRQPSEGHGGGGYQGGGGDHGGGGQNPDSGSRQYDTLGLGDLYLSGAVVVLRDVFDRNTLAASATLKAPVASATEGFGTGEWDAALGLSWHRRTATNQVSAELSYWWLGDAPDLELSNPLAFEASYGCSLKNPRWFAEVSLWGRTRTVEDVSGLLAMGVTIHRSVRGAHAVYATAEAGLTESAPDVAVAVGLRFRLGGLPTDQDAGGSAPRR